MPTNLPLYLTHSLKDCNNLDDEKVYINLFSMIVSLYPDTFDNFLLDIC